MTGAIRFWQQFNNGQFAAGLFVGSYGADPAYTHLVDKGKIMITIDPLIKWEGVMPRDAM